MRSIKSARPGNVGAGRRDPAAEILDQRARDHVGADLERLALFDQLAVTVVDEDDGLRCVRPHDGDDVRDVVDRKRVPRSVAARTLHEDDGRGARSERAPSAARSVLPTSVRGDLSVDHAAGCRRVRRVGERVAQRVVRRAVRTQQRAPGGNQGFQAPRRSRASR